MALRQVVFKGIIEAEKEPVTSNIDQLCSFFECRIQDIMEYIPDTQSDN